MRAGKFMMSEKKYRERGLMWLERSIEDIRAIEKYVNRHYSEEKMNEFSI